ncbi:transcriptional regulator [Paenibacillus sp. VTT E-133280]|uniref:helix-turn-helix transcriptional regulator n=1 Tax=unclassified Paenibacillus TaxID=185978 RepID=UPI000BA01BD2|nr:MULTISPECIES: helix-turn-helix transcriptional regulator [unclassified Paenibacillus]MDH6373582.1 transcriptional regulator with XRE-family HTH domain [Paenibacillus sp. PastF-3]OZQ66107.1 transcriptional regulator [Paenibacillus sp. VTT E-133280]
MNATPAYLKNTLRSLRVRLGLSQKDAAKMLGISDATLRIWEEDSTKISQKKVWEIERIYYTKQDFIFFGPESAFSEILQRQAVLDKN